MDDKNIICPEHVAFFLGTRAEKHGHADQIGESITQLSAAPSPIPEMVNSQFCSELRKSQDCKSDSPPQSELCEGRRRNMKTSTKDKFKGNFHEVKGTIKEEIGKVTKDHNLKAEGKAEKKAGKVQQRIGHAKEGIAKLKGRLAELKK
jgi:uncharacterized protein YjbJ (UPF0337 family)